MPIVDAKFQGAKDRMAALVNCAVAGRTGEDAFARLEDVVKTNAFWENRLRDVMLSLTWPVLDIAATAKTNHCTKSIFSLHAKTGRVAVPVNRLFATPNYPLPPVVTPDQIGVPGTESAKRFGEGVELLVRAHRVVARHAFPLDMEDLVAPPPKKKMCV